MKLTFAALLTGLLLLPAMARADDCTGAISAAIDDPGALAALGAAGDGPALSKQKEAVLAAFLDATNRQRELNDYDTLYNLQPDKAYLQKGAVWTARMVKAATLEAAKAKLHNEMATLEGMIAAVCQRLVRQRNAPGPTATVSPTDMPPTGNVSPPNNGPTDNTSPTGNVSPSNNPPTDNTPPSANPSPADNGPPPTNVGANTGPPPGGWPALIPRGGNADVDAEQDSLSPSMIAAGLAIGAVAVGSGGGGGHHGGGHHGGGGEGGHHHSGCTGQ